jgi:hypothetical protein
MIGPTTALWAVLTIAKQLRAYRLYRRRLTAAVDVEIEAPAFQSSRTCCLRSDGRPGRPIRAMRSSQDMQQLQRCRVDRLSLPDNEQQTASTRPTPIDIPDHQWYRRCSSHD